MPAFFHSSWLVLEIVKCMCLKFCVSSHTRKIFLNNLFKLQFLSYVLLLMSFIRFKSFVVKSMNFLMCAELNCRPFITKSNISFTEKLNISQVGKVITVQNEDSRFWQKLETEKWEYE